MSDALWTTMWHALQKVQGVPDQEKHYQTLQLEDSADTQQAATSFDDPCAVHAAAIVDCLNLGIELDIAAPKCSTRLTTHDPGPRRPYNRFHPAMQPTNCCKP